MHDVCIPYRTNYLVMPPQSASQEVVDQYIGGYQHVVTNISLSGNIYQNISIYIRIYYYTSYKRENDEFTGDIVSSNASLQNEWMILN